MAQGERVGEDESNVPGSANIGEVQRRLAEIRQRRRPGVSWRVTKHTAEMTIRALEGEAREPYRRSSKNRRRKREKRLL
jgi:hypothetical protein